MFRHNERDGAEGGADCGKERNKTKRTDTFHFIINIYVNPHSMHSSGKSFVCLFIYLLMRL